MGASNSTWREGSLQRNFLAVILAVYAAVTVGSILVFAWSAGSISERYARRFSVSQGELEKERILSLLDRELALARKLADDPVIIRWTENEGDPHIREEALAQLESYRRFLRDGAWFLAMRQSASYYARTPASAGVEKTRLDPANSADRWFYSAIASGKDFSLNVDHNAMLGENRVWINVLMRSADGSPVGVAGCGLDLTSFLSALLGAEEPGVTTVIVDAKGILQAYRDRSLIAHNAEASSDSAKVDVFGLLTSPADRKALRATLAMAGSGRHPDVMALSFLGRRQLCSVSALPELGWYSLVFVDARSVIGPADFVPIALVTLGALLAVLAAVIAASGRLVVGPIRKLTEAAGLLASGSYEMALPDGPRNEIGRLAASFKTMAAKVRDNTSSLEGLVDERTRELRVANEDLESSRRRVMDSIEYARLIQDSIFPTEIELDSALSGHFVIARQRDIVGGDFLFFRRTAYGFCAAMADCTGHGVPGAFMTMLVKAHLDRVVEDSEPGGSMLEAPPSSMLRELDRLVSESLERESETAHLQNGLDMAIVQWRRAAGELRFSGAGLPLLVWSEGGLSMIPGERTHLGFSRTGRRKDFVDRIMTIDGVARIYLCTDGILDLPGGDRGLPFGHSRLEALLRKCSLLGFPEARAAVEATLDEWRGRRPQRDDLSLACFGLDPRKETK